MISETSAQSGPPPKRAIRESDTPLWPSWGHELYDKNDPTNHLLKPTLPSDLTAQGPLATKEQRNKLFSCVG